MVNFDLNSYIENHNKVISNFDRDEIKTAISIIRKTMKSGARIATCGNGGSALTASHFITDWNKMVHSHTGLRFNGICLSDNIGIVTAYSNDYSYDEIYSEQVKNLLKENDLLITISGSGNSKNVINATIEANKLNINTLSITGYDGGELKRISKYSVWIRSNDMQICEDAHIVFGHIVMKDLCNLKVSTI